MRIGHANNKFIHFYSNNLACKGKTAHFPDLPASVNDRFDRNSIAFANNYLIVCGGTQDMDDPELRSKECHYIDLSVKPWTWKSDVVMQANETWNNPAVAIGTKVFIHNNLMYCIIPVSVIK